MCCYHNILTLNSDLFNFLSIEWKVKGASDFFFLIQHHIEAFWEGTIVLFCVCVEA